ncbi:MAG: HAD-IB family hydrolase [Desulfobacula sp.]|jgi:HAD superfamily hydrolase (TIGR01490 family)
MKTRLAIFDFDGTITRRDTFLLFLVFCFGWVKVCRIGIRCIPVLLGYKLNLISNSKAKETIFGRFFKKTGLEEFNEFCRRFSLGKISPVIRVSALEKIIRHKVQGDKIIIISASIENWIRPWADSYGIDDVIGTTAETEGLVLTGKFGSPNCYGEEKVGRFIRTYGDPGQYHIFAYGDSRGDKELLAIADEPFYKLF